MPTTKSAQKALRKDTKRTRYNRAHKNRIKAISKKMRTLVVSGKEKDAQQELSKAHQVLDKAAKSGVIKKEQADRKKSRLSLLVKKASS